MKIVEQSHEILTEVMHIKLIPQMIELAGRTCYKSENKITENSANDFCHMLIKRGHEAMIEHGNISVRFITDRGVTHELVRHRLASFAQESTRYVKYDGDIEFIRPVFDWGSEDCPEDNTQYVNRKYVKFLTWEHAMIVAEIAYKNMIEQECPPQETRSVLPNSLKTEIVVTANIREWRHIFKLRTSKAAHPQIRELMIPLLKELKKIIPVLFDDIEAGKIHLYGEKK